jgi:hypothetical protein
MAGVKMFNTWRTAARRLVNTLPEDIAGVCVLLASGASDYISSQTLNTEGSEVMN